VFITTPEFLNQHRQHREQTRQLLATATANGQVRLAEMNQQVLGNFDCIITALEADHDPNPSKPRTRQMRADNTHHLRIAARRRSQATRERAIRALRRLAATGDPVTFRHRRPHGGRVPLLAVCPTRPAPRDRPAPRPTAARAAPSSPPVPPC
jgi:hypothetical protein